MKNILILACALFFINLLSAQNNAIKITDIITNDIIILEAGKRIRVTTVEGKKHSGVLRILEDNSIVVHNTQLTLDQISKMKPHPLLLTVVTSALFVYTGLITAGLSLIIASFGGEAIGLVGLIPAAGLLYGGIKGTNILQGYSITDDYSFELVKI